MKDETTVLEGGEQERLRKYYLTVYLNEAYCMFKNLHPDISVEFSKFASLRPQNVKTLMFCCMNMNTLRQRLIPQCQLEAAIFSNLHQINYLPGENLSHMRCLIFMYMLKDIKF